MNLLLRRACTALHKVLLAATLACANYVAAIVSSVTQYFVLFWMAAICFNTLQVAVFSNSQTQRWEVWYHLVCWGVPLAFSLIPLAFGVYSYTRELPIASSSRARLSFAESMQHHGVGSLAMSSTGSLESTTFPGLC